MNILLKPECEEFIRVQMQRKKYGSIEELIEKALLLLKRQEEYIVELHQKIEVGTTQIFEGQVTDGEFVFKKIQKDIDSILT